MNPCEHAVSMKILCGVSWRKSGFARESSGDSVLMEHPLFGIGPETFGGEFRRTESPELSRAYPDFLQETPHNIFIDTACSQGFIGLSILVGVLVTGYFAGLAQSKEPVEL